MIAQGHDTPPTHTPTHPGNPPKPTHHKPSGHKKPSTPSKPTKPSTPSKPSHKPPAKKPPAHKPAGLWEPEFDEFPEYPLPGLKQGGHIH